MVNSIKVAEFIYSFAHRRVKILSSQLNESRS